MRTWAPLSAPAHRSGNVLTKATAWLVVLFFATSFGLALVATQNSVATDDLGLDIPVPVTSEADMPALEDEMPVVEDEIPVMSAPESADESEDLPDVN